MPDNGPYNVVTEPVGDGLPRPLSLLGSAWPLELERDGRPVQLDAGECGLGGSWLSCPPPGRPPQTKDSFGSGAPQPDIPVAQPFTVYAVENCGMGNTDIARDRAERKLADTITAITERVFWGHEDPDTGPEVAARIVTNLDDPFGPPDARSGVPNLKTWFPGLIDAPGTYTPVEAIGALERIMAALTGRPGMIHVPIGYGIDVQGCFRRTEAGDYVTPTGTRIVIGTGYHGGTESPGDWFYATLPVGAHVGDLVTHESLDRSDNTYSVVAERDVTLVVNPCFAARVQVERAATGGGNGGPGGTPGTPEPVTATLLKGSDVVTGAGPFSLAAGATSVSLWVRSGTVTPALEQHSGDALGPGTYTWATGSALETFPTTEFTGDAGADYTVTWTVVDQIIVPGAGGGGPGGGAIS